MDKKVLTEVDLYYGDVEMPKGFEIDRDKIRDDIIESYVKKSRINNSPRAYAYDDYEVPFSQPLQWFLDYIRDHFKAEYHYSLIPKQIRANIMHPKERSWVRHLVDPVDLKNSSDYTLVYGVDINKNSCECIIEYDDNRRKNRTWHMPLENNNFIIFPATNRFSISPNISKGLNTILIVNYEYI